MESRINLSAKRAPIITDEKNQAQYRPQSPLQNIPLGASRLQIERTRTVGTNKWQHATTIIIKAHFNTKE